VRNEVKQRLHAANMTQQGLADAVDVSRQTIISVEQGRYRPSVELALKLARALGSTVEDLYTLEDEP
jgi:putative transcriptional regulator